MLQSALFTVASARRRAHERGLLESLKRREQVQRKARRLDGAGETQLVAITYSSPPDGSAQWTLRLMRERLVELDVVESIGLETIHNTLKKTRSNPG